MSAHTLTTERAAALSRATVVEQLMVTYRELAEAIVLARRAQLPRCVATLSQQLAALQHEIVRLVHVAAEDA